MSTDATRRAKDLHDLASQHHDHFALARHYYLQALALDPGRDGSWFNLASLSLSYGYYDDAAAAATEALALIPQHPAYTDLMQKVMTVQTGAPPPPALPPGTRPLALEVQDLRAQREAGTAPVERPVMDPIENDDLTDDIRLVRRIGQGSESTVYLAHQRSLNREMAVKVLARPLAKNDKIVTRFLEDAQRLARLSHANVVAVYGTGRLDIGSAEDVGRPYIILEYVRGQTLAEMLVQEGRLPWARAWPILSQILTCLEAIHATKALHLDLKPSNLMLVRGTEPPVVKVLDFGLIQMAGDLGDGEALIVTGSPLYTPPERILASAGRVGPWTDVYAAAVIAYEMLAGRTPFRGKTSQEVLQQQVEVAPPPFPDDLAKALPPGVESALLKALAKNPAQRFQSAGELAQALATAATAPQPADPPPKPAAPPPPPKPKPRPRWLVPLLGGLGALALVATLSVVLWRACAPARCADGTTEECRTTCGTVGHRTCVAGVFGPCQPPAEACNDRDDNCDGQTDEGCPPKAVCTDGAARPCPTPCGSEGRQTCAAGQWTPCLPPAEVCNGRDDDCNGRVDDNTTCEREGRVCRDGVCVARPPDPPPACVPGSTRPCPTACGSAGQETCVNGTFGPCVPPTEVCNGRDEDCNGLVDDNAVCDPPGSRCVNGACVGPAEPPCRTGARRDCPTPCGTTGTQLCRDRAWDVCTPPAETCDAVDNDCNGRVDDGDVCARDGMERATDRPGNDLRPPFPLPASDPAACRDACQRDAACRAWTYTRPATPEAAPLCALKATPGSPARNRNAVSGLRATPAPTCQPGERRACRLGLRPRLVPGEQVCRPDRTWGPCVPTP